MDNKYPSQQNQCPVCNMTDISVFLEILQMPIHCNVIWRTREEAMQACRGDIRLGFCRDCGHIFNLAFKPYLIEYTKAYENSLHFSARFQSYAESLVARLIDRHNLQDKDIIEIGCGKGDFLRLLCQAGANRGIGFDPGYKPKQNTKRNTTEQIRFIPDFYSKHYTNHKADLVCCRHVLEHIQFPKGFLNDVRHSMRDKHKTVLFFEVPNVSFILRELSIWDVIYEHCSYFSSSSLSHLFTSCEFDVLNVRETYEGQFLSIEALPGESSGNSAGYSEDDLEGLAATFVDKYRRKVETWQRKLEQMTQAGQRVVIWGAGSKGVTFLNTLRIRGQIEYVVDINPRKQGRYVAGTGQQIVPPELLQAYQPDVIIIMNPIYLNEIQQITLKLGLAAHFVCV